MLGHLRQLDFGYLHKVVYFILGPLEIFDAERIYRHGLDSRLVADF